MPDFCPDKREIRVFGVFRRVLARWYAVTCNGILRCFVRRLFEALVGDLKIVLAGDDPDGATLAGSAGVVLTAADPSRDVVKIASGDGLRATDLEDITVSL